MELYYLQLHFSIVRRQYGNKVSGWGHRWCDRKGWNVISLLQCFNTLFFSPLYFTILKGNVLASWHFKTVQAHLTFHLSLGLDAWAQVECLCDNGSDVLFQLISICFNCTLHDTCNTMPLKTVVYSNIFLISF